MKILLLSDIHGEYQEAMAVIQAHPLMDEYIALGDIGFDYHKLRHFLVVKGNHDHEKELPKEKIINIEDRKVLCIHGDRFEAETVEEVMALETIPGEDLMKKCMTCLYRHIAAYAKQKGCDTVFFGHTHLQTQEEVDGVVLINPGSLLFGMDGHNKSYAVVEIIKKMIKVTFHEGTE